MCCPLPGKGRETWEPWAQVAVTPYRCFSLQKQLKVTNSFFIWLRMEGSASILPFHNLCSPPFFLSPCPSLHHSSPWVVILLAGQQSCFGSSVFFSSSSDHKSCNTAHLGWHTVKKRTFNWKLTCCAIIKTIYNVWLFIHIFCKSHLLQIQGTSISLRPSKVLPNVPLLTGAVIRAW